MNALRILYLEDNPDHVALVADALQPQYPATQVETATSLADAIACMRSRNYDIVLVNATLHGESMIPRLRNCAEHADSTPIIVISGNRDEKSAANAIKNGATDYLVKSRESLEVLPYLIQRRLKKKRHPSSDAHHPVTPPMPGNVDHLMTEIEHVAQRIHKLQDTPYPDAAIAALKEDLRLLREFAEDIVESRKSRKTEK